MRNSRVWGTILWLFSFHVFVATSGGGKLGQNIWLDIATGVIMFTAAAYLLGMSLSYSEQFSFVVVIMLIAVSSALITFNVYEQSPYRWFDMMTIVAAPQMMAMAIGSLLAFRRQTTDDV